MNVLIVEDETAAYENLKSLLAETDPSLEISGHTESVVQTVRWLNNHVEPDLIFMDIHLSDGSAFTIFTAIEINTPVIFTTAYDEYAISAFKVNSIDYLLKPISQDDLKQALEKFHKLTALHTTAYLSQLSQLLTSVKYIGKILIPVNNDLRPVDVQQISYFYSTENNTRAVLKDNTNYQYQRTLDNIYNSLNPALFFRANKQFIISKSSVKNITVRFDNRLHILLDTEAPERIYVSKNKAAQFKKWLTME